MKQPSIPHPLASADGWSIGDLRDLSLPLVVFPRRINNSRPANVRPRRVPETQPMAAVRACVQRYLSPLGSILFRSFAVHDAREFACFASALGLHVSPLPGLVAWGEAAQGRMCVGCGEAAPLQTLAGSALVDICDLERGLSIGVRTRLIERGVRYARRFTALGHKGSNWQQAFRTTDRTRVEAWCAEHGLVFRGLHGNALRVEYAGSVFAQHPNNRESRWIHAGPLFDFAVARCDQAGERDYGFQVGYADGSAIERHVLDELHEVFMTCARPVEWMQGDVILLDRWASWLHIPRSQRAVLHFAADYAWDDSEE